MQYKIKNKIRLIELFAGIGSQAMALKKLGADFEHYRVIEFDKYAIQSYNLIHNTNFETTDIQDIIGSDLGIEDTDNYEYIMTYSFPCQSLSIAGKQEGMEKGTGTRSGLLWEVERLLNETENLPQILIMENVTQVSNNKNKPHFDSWIEFLKSKGYSNYYENVNSKDYGIPQNRNRTFMVSILGQYTYNFPKKQDLNKSIKDFLKDEKGVDKKHYMNSTMKKKVVTQLIDKGVLKYSRIKGTDIKDILLGSTQKNAHIGTIEGLSPTLTSSMGTGGGHVPLIIYNSKTESEIFIEQGKMDLEQVDYNEIDFDKIEIRRLSPLECWELMGFDMDDYNKIEGKVSNSMTYKQIGNSIVMDVIQNIIGELL